jgi:hypothetical protein
VKVTVKPLYVGMVFSFSVNVESAVTACSSKDVCGRINTSPLWASCHPVNIFQFFHSPNEYLGIKLRFLTASYCVRAYAAIATRRFTAVWANTFAVIYEITASLTYWFFFSRFHHFSTR